MPDLVNLVLNIISFIKIKERDSYIFFYDDEGVSRDALYKVFLNYAENKELSFNYNDANILIDKLNRTKNTNIIIK